MIDSQDDDSALIVIDLVDHSIRAPSCRVKPREFALETSADTVGGVDEGTQHELDDCSGSSFGESAQLPLRRSGDTQFVWCVVLAHFEAKRARSSSPVM